MEKENIFILMVVIILEIGSKEKCKETDNCLILKEIYSIKENGGMITLKEKENFTAIMARTIGINMKDNSNLELKMDSDSYSSKMVIDIKVNSETIYYGVKEGFSIKMETR